MQQQAPENSHFSHSTINNGMQNMTMQSQWLRKLKMRKK